MAQYLFSRAGHILLLWWSGQDCGKSFLLPRIFLFSLPHLYFLSGCPTYSFCLPAGQSAFI